MDRDGTGFLATDLAEDLAAVRADLGKLSGLVAGLLSSQAAAAGRRVSRDPIPSLLLAVAGGYALGRLIVRRG